MCGGLRSRWSAGATTLALALVVAPPAASVTFTVDSELDGTDVAIGDGACRTSSGTCSLRAAVQESNDLAGPDTIVLPAGRFTLSIPGTDEGDAATGDLDLRDDVVLRGAGRDET